MMVRAKVGQTIFLGLLMAALFWGVGDYFNEDGVATQVAVFDLVGSIFFVCVNQTMMNMMGTVTIFCNERPVFLREQANAMYGVVPYYMTKTLVEMPIMIITPLILSAIIYPSMDLAGDVEKFFGFFFLLFLLVLTATSFGYMFASIFP